MNIAAYKERESIDHQTGLEGTLRDEWRVRLVKDFDPLSLTQIWGDDWMRYRPAATHVLEHRYIRRGTEEPWKPFDAANNLSEALGYIDSRAVPADTPQGRSLAKLQQKWAEEARLVAEKKEAEEKAQFEQEEKERQKEASNKAFLKLQMSPRDGHWATEWNTFIETATKVTRDAVRSNPDILTTYQAVMDAVTMPAKRKAIRIFLEGPARILPR